MKKMKIIIILLFISFFSTLLPAQNISNQPNVNINVKVQKDSLGNIVSYDSTVVITYGSGNFPLNSDSLYKAFIEKFNSEGFTIPDSSFFAFPSPGRDFFDMSKEFERMDEMFMKSMQMMMMQDFFDFIEKNQQLPHNKENKKTIKEKVKLQPAKI